jgi:D-amino-acid dehydrogenase
VIGAGRDGRVFHAYGHGHIGLTLAPITAAMIADMVKGIQPHQAARACSPLRF